MEKPTNAPRQLELKLTDEQRREIVQFLASHGSTKVELDINFEADAKVNALAPVTVLVGMAT